MTREQRIAAIWKRLGDQLPCERDPDLAWLLDELILALNVVRAAHAVNDGRLMHQGAPCATTLATMLAEHDRLSSGSNREGA